MQWSGLGWGIATLLSAGGGVPQRAARDLPNVDVIAETFFTSKPTIEGLGHRMSWIQATTRPTPDSRIVGTMLYLPTVTQVDETYYERTLGNSLARVGRFRNPLGFGTWNDSAYMPAIGLPMVRTNLLTPSLTLVQQPAGFDVEAPIKDVTVRLMLVDPFTGTGRVFFDQPRYAIGRVEGTVGPLILGAGLMAPTGKSNTDRIYGFDLIWTTPRIQVRGQQFYGTTRGRAAGDGFAWEVFYRPPGTTRLQYGVRTERYKKSSASPAVYLTRAGVRWTASPHLAITVNYAWGSPIAPAGPARGITVDILTAIRF